MCVCVCVCVGCKHRVDLIQLRFIDLIRISVTLVCVDFFALILLQFYALLL